MKYAGRIAVAYRQVNSDERGVELRLARRGAGASNTFIHSGLRMPPELWKQLQGAWSGVHRKVWASEGQIAVEIGMHAAAEPVADTSAAGVPREQGGNHATEARERPD